MEVRDEGKRDKGDLASVDPHQQPLTDLEILPGLPQRRRAEQT